MKHRVAAVVLAALLAGCWREPLSVPMNRAGGGAPDIPGNPGDTHIRVAGALVKNQSVMFSNTGCFDHEGYTRHWEFSDGSTADGGSVSHAFPAAGSYTVTLTTTDSTVTDVEGAVLQHSHSMTVQVLAAAPDTTTQLPDQARRR